MSRFGSPIFFREALDIDEIPENLRNILTKEQQKEVTAEVSKPLVLISHSLLEQECDVFTISVSSNPAPLTQKKLKKFNKKKPQRDKIIPRKQKNISYKQNKRNYR